MTRRLLVSYLSLTLFVLIILEVPLAVLWGARERERFVGAVESDAVVLATVFEDALEQDRPPPADPAADYHLRVGARVVVVDDAGISIFDTDLDAGRDFSTRPEIATALNGRRATGTRRSETLGTDLAYVAVPVASSGIVHGAVRITLPNETVNQRVYRFWFGLATVGGVVLVAMAGIGWALARSVTRPIRSLQRAATSFAAGDLAPVPVPPDAPPELVDLAETLNTMARRLGEQFDAQRAFVADASHQLRTPLTALRLRLENLQAELDAGATADEVDAAIDETARLGALVEDLLRLARLDRAIALCPVDLLVVAADRVDTWTAVAESAGVTLRLDAPTDAADAIAAEGAVEQILDNLLDNALGVAPAGSEIVVALRPGVDWHRLEVRDRGPGLDDEHRERAFDRFWRGRTDHGGTGLGLAIARGLARTGGGDIELLANEPSGLRAVVRLRAGDLGEPTRAGGHQGASPGG